MALPISVIFTLFTVLMHIIDNEPEEARGSFTFAKKKRFVCTIEKVQHFFNLALLMQIIGNQPAECLPNRKLLQ